MKRIIILITFIPWFLYFYSENKTILKIISTKKDNKNYFKDNFFSLIPLTNIILYAILSYFSISYKTSENIFVVRVLLFSAINLYLFFSTISKKDYILNMDNKEERLSFKYYLIALIPIIFFLVTKKHMTTYYIMLSLNLLAYFIIRIVGLPKNEK